MRKSFAVLFENKVFSKVPNQYGFESQLRDASFQKIGDTYFTVDPFWKDQPEIISSLDYDTTGKLFIFDPVETFFRDERIKNSKEIKMNLEFAKKIIADEHYPAFLECWPEESTYIDENGLESGIPNLFSLSGGRSVLVKMISENRYSEALPELREIALHDDSENMRNMAIFATGPLERKKADEVVNEVLDSTKNRYLIMNIAHYIMKYSVNNLFVANLRKKFEEHYLDYVENYLSIKWMSTVPQSIILACGSILSLDSLSLIEEGIKHPYPHVEQNAKHALYMWTERVARNKIDDEKLMKKVVEVCKKYDMGNYFENSSWKHFHKKSTFKNPASFL